MGKTSKHKSQPAATVSVSCLDAGIGDFVVETLARLAVKVAQDESTPLLLALTGSDPQAELEIVREALALGRQVLCWGVHDELDIKDLGTARALAEQWTVERLAEQAGAVVSPKLDVLAELLRLQLYGIDFRLPVAPPDRDAPALVQRLASRLLALSTEAATDVDAGLRVELKENNQLVLLGNHAEAPLTSIDTTAEALALARRLLTDGAPGPLTVVADTKELGSIVKPPSRLLSEVTSKRLLGCFGLEAPQEALCRSASEAGRAAEQLGGDIVVKLVRPELEAKLCAGLVIMEALGPTAVRRATAELLARGDELGPPPSLGVLVSQRIHGGSRLWLQLDHHPHLGRMLLGGIGDVPGPAPQLALSIPFDIAAAWRALSNARVPGSPVTLSALARGLARLSVAIETLGSDISRLEVHPLVARDDLPEALLLDALVRLQIEPRRPRSLRR